jgi:hypothetical protein
MKKNILLLTMFMGISVINGSSENGLQIPRIESYSNAAEIAAAVDYYGTCTLDRESDLVGRAYQCFSGQNILNARDVNYVEGLIKKDYPIETLYGLYLALQEFFNPVTEQFKPDDLNGGFTLHNYECLTALFAKDKQAVSEESEAKL